jgi:cytidine deaminase
MRPFAQSIPQVIRPPCGVCNTVFQSLSQGDREHPSAASHKDGEQLTRSIDKLLNAHYRLLTLLIGV